MRVAYLFLWDPSTYPGLHYHMTRVEDVLLTTKMLVSQWQGNNAPQQE
jgi:hypothetical protein